MCRLAAWSTGFVLENVGLKVDAFDYLQLPFAVRSGCIGRLEVQASTYWLAKNTGAPACSL